MIDGNLTLLRVAARKLRIGIRRQKNAARPSMMRDH
jgi:hypothetical protein